MNILYDISVLGIGHHTARARTGIFRVIENLAYELNKSEECKLNFCTSGSAIRLLQVIDYLESNSQFSNVPLIYREVDMLRNAKSYKKYLDLTRQIELSGEQHIKILLKLSRKTSVYINSLKNLIYQYKSLTEKDLKKSQIYHSPFEVIPNQFKKYKNLKLVLTVYDLIPTLYPRFFNFNETINQRKALSNLNFDSWITCISHSTKIDLCNYLPNLDPSKIQVTHLAASDLFYPCKNVARANEVCSKYSIPDVPYILSLSTLEPRKNIAHTIRSFLNLIQQEKFSDLNLVLAGTKGWNYDSIFAEISDNSSLKDRVILTGFVDDEDLAPLYSNALAFVYPSFYEGFGLPPLEAMQCGVPVITSNTSSLPEVVGNAGIMLDPRDSDGLSQSILNLYNQPTLRDSMANQSLSQAQKFSWENCAKHTVAAYKCAISS
jgi:glycosyltransferase involved in cell wall biosynthesis